MEIMNGDTEITSLKQKVGLKNYFSLKKIPIYLYFI